MKVVFPEPAIPMHRMTGGLFSPAAGAVVFAAVDIVLLCFRCVSVCPDELVVSDALVEEKAQREKK